MAARGRELPDGSFDGAGPAVTASFAIASIVAFLCALCYTEFATAVPVAGGAYVYVTLTFGELAAWLVGTNLLLEYTLSSAAVARGWTSYLAETMQMEPSALRVNLGGERSSPPSLPSLSRHYEYLSVSGHHGTMVAMVPGLMLLWWGTCSSATMVPPWCHHGTMVAMVPGLMLLWWGTCSIALFPQ